MTIRKRLERAISKGDPNRNRPEMDCVLIIDAFSDAGYGFASLQEEIYGALVWMPSGWRTIARMEGEADEEFRNRILRASSKPSIA